MPLRLHPEAQPIASHQQTAVAIDVESLVCVPSPRTGCRAVLFGADTTVVWQDERFHLGLLSLTG